MSSMSNSFVPEDLAPAGIIISSLVRTTAYYNNGGEEMTSYGRSWCGRAIVERRSFFSSKPKHAVPKNWPSWCVQKVNRKNFPGATWSRTRRPFRRKGGGSGVPHFPTSSRSPRGFPYSPTRERETNQSALPVDNRGRETDQSSSTQPHPKGRSLDERFRSGREASAASPSFPLLFFLFPIFFSSPS